MNPKIGNIVEYNPVAKCPANDVEAAKAYHKENGLVSNGVNGKLTTCDLGACALHYPTTYPNIYNQWIIGIITEIYPEDTLPKMYNLQLTNGNKVCTTIEHLRKPSKAALAKLPSE